MTEPSEFRIFKHRNEAEFELFKVKNKAFLTQTSVDR